MDIIFQERNKIFESLNSYFDNRNCIIKCYFAIQIGAECASDNSLLIMSHVRTYESIFLKIYIFLLVLVNYFLLFRVL